LQGVPQRPYPAGCIAQRKPGAEAAEHKTETAGKTALSVLSAAALSPKPHQTPLQLQHIYVHWSLTLIA